MNFSDIPQLTPPGNYEVDIPLDHLEQSIARYMNIENGSTLDLLPDFQRGHVWTEDQARNYVEYLLRGGMAQRVIYFNHPGWMNSFQGDFVIVDGLQRLTACLRFVRNELAVFGGHFFKDFEGYLGFSVGLKFNINNIQTREGVLRWYLEMNSGGTPHSDEELERVQALLDEESE